MPSGIYKRTKCAGECLEKNEERENNNEIDNSTSS